MDVHEQVTEVFNLLIKEHDSPLVHFRDKFPQNDSDYLDMWFAYFNYAYTEGKWLKSFMETYTEPDTFQFHYFFTQKIKAFFEQQLQKKLQKIDFTPRVEEYIVKRGLEENMLHRKFLLAFLYYYEEDRVSISAEDIARKVRIPRIYFHSLTQEHPFFADRIIEFEDSSLNEDRPFHKKDLFFDRAVFNLFSGYGIPDDEYASFVHKPVAQLFGYEVCSLDGEAAAGSTLSSSGDESYEEFDIEGILSGREGARSGFHVENNGEENTSERSVAADNTDVSESEDVSTVGELTLYEDDLEYLYHEYQWIEAMLAAREKQADSYPFDRTQQERTVIQLKQRCRRLKNACKVRLQRSRDQGFIPRLEHLAEILKLNEFEKNVLKVLITMNVFHTSNDYHSMRSMVRVGDLLLLLIDDPRERVHYKRAFLKASRLVKNNIIYLDINSIEDNIYDINVQIDNRLIEYLIGEQFDISDYVEGGFLYRSGITLDQVVLPEEHKKRILQRIDTFPRFLQEKSKINFSNIVEYGNALVMLFVGPSGTGKTMCAHAVSNAMNKKVLQFNLNNLFHLTGTGDKRVFSLLFRESRMHDAVLFFDEAEALLTDRIQDLLIELEKHEGLVIFATNATFRIDEAIRRRINLIVNFQEPGPALRKEIWELHLPHNVDLASDLDLDRLAHKYELNGGLIKNAVFSALSCSTARAAGGNIEINMEDLCYGAEEQLHNKLFMTHLQDVRIPQKGTDAVVLPESTAQIVGEIIDNEKARKVLEGQWGFNEVFPDHNGCAVLFHGPSGTGKTYTAEAIAFETGKTLKVVNYARVLSMWVGETEKSLETLFKEVADKDSILLFDEADALFAPRTGVSSANDRYANVEIDVLLGLIERYNTFAVLTTNFIENIDKAFHRRLRYVVEFQTPSRELRSSLWHTLLPPKLPLDDSVDIEKLAEQYAFTGGEIKNVIIRAATRAALSLEAGAAVGQKDFLTVCDEVKASNRNGRNKIGFTAT
jgi:SpoVK/Ycf46/Vps4 family AAA+-type ATPase